MKVIILAGGFGTRLGEVTDLIPKPMVEIGGLPIIVHIMNHYAHYGHSEFYIALGYKADYIKNYFNNFFERVHGHSIGNEELLNAEIKKLGLCG